MRSFSTAVARRKLLQPTMNFGSEYVFVPSAEKEEYELVPESVFNHTVVGYASTSADYKDDGEVQNEK